MQIETAKDAARRAENVPKRLPKVSRNPWREAFKGRPRIPKASGFVPRDLGFGLYVGRCKPEPSFHTNQVSDTLDQIRKNSFWNFPFGWGMSSTSIALGWSHPIELHVRALARALILVVYI